MGYLVSILVPTKNRYPYLFKLMEVIDGFQSKDIELVIQDNNDDNSTILEYFRKNGKKDYIVYDWHKESLPVYKNSDYAVRNSSGQYVCFIGDDDGVSKYIIDCCKWMRENDIEVVFPRGYYYFWPDAHISERYKGSIKWSELNTKMVVRDSRHELNKLLSDGITTDGILPRLYHGIVKRSALDCIWEKCGSYFPGASPDIANGVALSFVVDKFATIQFPVCYSGASKHLGGGAVAMKHKGTTDFKSLPFLPGNIEDIWYEKIPKVWTAPTIYCESAIESMRNMGHEDLIEEIDFEKLYVYLVAHFSYFRSLAYALTNNKSALFLGSMWIKLKYYWDGGIRIFKRKLLHINPDKGYSFVHGLDDIVAVNNYIEKQCDNKEIKFHI